MEALGITPFGLIAYTVNFLILVVLLRLLLYKPVLGMLEKRKQKIVDGLQAAERAEQQAAAQRKDFEAQLQTARHAAQEEARGAAEGAERLRQEILSAARQEAEEIKLEAREETQRERALMEEELQRQSGELAIAIAQRLIGEAADAEAQRRVVDRFISELEAGG